MTAQMPKSNTTMQEQFLDAVLSQVRFRFDHPDIRRELAAHIEDRTACYLEEGESPENAASLAVACMGDAKELGRLLDREHSPVLGWLWRISRAAAAVAVLLLLICLISGPASLFFKGLEQNSDDYVARAISPYLNAHYLYHVELNQRIPLGDDGTLVKAAVYSESLTGQAEALPQVFLIFDHGSRFRVDPAFTTDLTVYGSVSDDEGNYYFSGLMLGGPRYAVVQIIDVPRDLSRLYWDYSRLDTEIRVEIPLIPNYKPEGGDPT